MAILSRPSVDSIDAISRIVKEIIYVSPQLYSCNCDATSKLPPMPHSTSILVKSKGKFFLITAGHSVQVDENIQIGIMLKSDFYIPQGTMHTAEVNFDDDYAPEKLDITILEIESSSVPDIEEQYRFLDVNKVKFNSLPSPETYYLLVGYPGASTTRNFPTKTITPEPLLLLTGGQPLEFYFKQNLNYLKTLALLLNHEQITLAKTGELVKPVDLGGISGCGVWEISEINSSNPQYHLVSMVTGEDDTLDVLFSTKIDTLKLFINPPND